MHTDNPASPTVTSGAEEEGQFRYKSSNLPLFTARSPSVQLPVGLELLSGLDSLFSRESAGNIPISGVLATFSRSKPISSRGLLRKFPRAASREFF
jgi:hypothetical protein